MTRRLNIKFRLRAGRGKTDLLYRRTCIWSVAIAGGLFAICLGDVRARAAEADKSPLQVDEAGALPKPPTNLQFTDARGSAPRASASDMFSAGGSVRLTSPVEGPTRSFATASDGAAVPAAQSAARTSFSLTEVIRRRRGALVDEKGPADPESVLAAAWRDDDGTQFIRQASTLQEGDEQQLQTVLSFPQVDSTYPEQRVDTYFVDPPVTTDAPLALKDVIIYTLKNSPDIGIARWQSEDALAAIKVARAPARPQVEISAGTGHELTYGEELEAVGGLLRSEGSIRITQRLLDFGRTSQAIKRAKALHQSSELLQRDVIEETVLSAVSAYLDLLGSDQLLQNADTNVSAHEDIVALVEKNYRLGNTSEAELKRAQSRLDRARTAAIDTENRRERAINRFREVTGLEPSLLSLPDLDMSLAFTLTTETVDMFIADNPLVQSVMRDINSFEHQINGAKFANRPEVSLQVVGAYRDNVLGAEPWTSDARAMVAATWNAYDGGTASARKQQLLARQKETEQRLIKVRNELKQDAANIISVLRTTQSKSEIFDEQVTSSERVMELYSKQFDAGRRTLLELLDAQADLSEAREEQIVTSYEALVAAFASMRFQNRLTYAVAEQYNLYELLDLPSP